MPDPIIDETIYSGVICCPECGDLLEIQRGPRPEFEYMTAAQWNAALEKSGNPNNWPQVQGGDIAECPDCHSPVFGELRKVPDESLA